MSFADKSSVTRMRNGSELLLLATRALITPDFNTEHYEPDVLCSTIHQGTLHRYTSKAITPNIMIDLPHDFPQLRNVSFTPSDDISMHNCASEIGLSLDARTQVRQGSARTDERMEQN